MYSLLFGVVIRSRQWSTIYRLIEKSFVLSTFNWQVVIFTNYVTERYSIYAYETEAIIGEFRFPINPFSFGLQQTWKCFFGLLVQLFTILLPNLGFSIAQSSCIKKFSPVIPSTEGRSKIQQNSCAQWSNTFSSLMRQMPKFNSPKINVRFR